MVGKQEETAAPEGEKRVEIPRVDELDGFINQARACAIAGITGQWLNIQVQKGLIEAIQIDGRTLLYKKDSVEAWQRTNPPVTPYKHAPGTSRRGVPRGMRGKQSGGLPS